MATITCEACFVPSFPTSSHQFSQIHIFATPELKNNYKAGCLSSQDARRISSLVFKMIRLNCRDFSRILRTTELCVMSRIRSFHSVRIVNDAFMLHSQCTNPNNKILTTRLMQHSVSFSRFPNKIEFIDYNRKRIGRSYFINRSRKIGTSISFDWIHLNPIIFKKKLKESIPLHII